MQIELQYLQEEFNIHQPDSSAFTTICNLFFHRHSGGNNDTSHRECEQMKSSQEIAVSSPQQTLLGKVITKLQNAINREKLPFHDTANREKIRNEDVDDDDDDHEIFSYIDNLTSSAILNLNDVIHNKYGLLRQQQQKQNADNTFSFLSQVASKQPQQRSVRIQMQKELKSQLEEIHQCRTVIEDALNDVVSWVEEYQNNSNCEDDDQDEDVVEKEIELEGGGTKKAIIKKKKQDDDENDDEARRLIEEQQQIIFDLCDELYHMVVMPKISACEFLGAVRVAFILRVEEVVKYASDFFGNENNKNDDSNQNNEHKQYKDAAMQIIQEYYPNRTEEEDENKNDKQRPAENNNTKRKKYSSTKQDVAVSESEGPVNNRRMPPTLTKMLVEAPAMMLKLIRLAPYSTATSVDQEDKYTKMLRDECGVEDASEWYDRVLEGSLSPQQYKNRKSSSISTTPKKMKKKNSNSDDDDDDDNEDKDKKLRPNGSFHSSFRARRFGEGKRENDGEEEQDNGSSLMRRESSMFLSSSVLLGGSGNGKRVSASKGNKKIKKSNNNNNSDDDDYAEIDQVEDPDDDDDEDEDEDERKPAKMKTCATPPKQKTPQKPSSDHQHQSSSASASFNNGRKGNNGSTTNRKLLSNSSPLPIPLTSSDKEGDNSGSSNDDDDDDDENQQQQHIKLGRKIIEWSDKIPRISQAKLPKLFDLIGKVRQFLFRHRLANEVMTNMFGGGNNTSGTATSGTGNDGRPQKVVPVLISNPDEDESMNMLTMPGGASPPSASASGSFHLNRTNSGMSSLLGASSSNLGAALNMGNTLSTKGQSASIFIPHKCDDALFPPRVSAAFESLCLKYDQMRSMQSVKARVKHLINLPNDEFVDAASKHDLFAQLLEQCDDCCFIGVERVELEDRLERALTVRIKVYHHSGEVRVLFVPQCRPLQHVLAIVEPTFADVKQCSLYYLDEGDKVVVRSDKDYSDALRGLRLAGGSGSGANGGGGGGGLGASSMSLSKTFVSSGFHDLRFDLYVDPPASSSSAINNKNSSSMNNTAMTSSSITPQKPSSASPKQQQQQELARSASAKRRKKKSSSSSSNMNMNGNDDDDEDEEETKNSSQHKLQMKQQGNMIFSAAQSLPTDLNVADILRQYRITLPDDDPKKRGRKDEEHKSEMTLAREREIKNILNSSASKKDLSSSYTNRKFEEARSTYDQAQNNIARLQKLAAQYNNNNAPNQYSAGVSSPQTARPPTSSSPPSKNSQFQFYPMPSTSQLPNINNHVSHPNTGRPSTSANRNNNNNNNNAYHPPSSAWQIPSSSAASNGAAWNVPVRTVNDMSLAQHTIVGDEFDDIRIEQRDKITGKRK